MEKSSFKYWFKHWKAFNKVAMQLHCWKFRFLFHDWEKPWLKLFLPYEIVRKIHRKYSRHHLESSRKKDYLAIIIDWECSRYTKSDATMNAREYFNYCNIKNKWSSDNDRILIEKTLTKLNL